MKTVHVRAAVAHDVPALWNCDAFAQAHPERKAYIERVVRQQQCFVAEAQGQVAGFAVLHHEFFEQGFISLVVVHGEFQRNGIAAQLIQFAERACQTPKLFSSTNASNLAAQQLLSKAGFARSGVVHNLDPHDPEYIYFKDVART